MINEINDPTAANIIRRAKKKIEEQKKDGIKIDFETVASDVIYEESLNSDVKSWYANAERALLAFTTKEISR